MDWGWLVDRYPEIAHLPQREQRLLIEAARRVVLRDVRHWVVGMIPVVVPLAGIVTITRFHPPSVWVAVMEGLVWLVLIVGAQFSTLRYRCRVMRRTIREELLRRGVRPAYCFDCGYDLRGTETDCCPECGSSIVTTPPWNA